MSPRKINRLSLVILFVGFAAAAAIWWAAPLPEGDALREDPLNEKRYRRQLRVIGGQANQLSADFIEWFESCWEGKNLGYTTAILTILATGVFRFVAVRLEPPPDERGS